MNCDTYFLVSSPAVDSALSVARDSGRLPSDMSNDDCWVMLELVGFKGALSLPGPASLSVSPLPETNVINACVYTQQMIDPSLNFQMVEMILQLLIALQITKLQKTKQD